MIELALFCRNEAPRVPAALVALSREAELLPVELWPLRVAVLENGSTDGTAAVAVKAARELQRPDLFEVEVRAGLPAGKTSSWNAFLASARADVLLFMDADVEPATGAVPVLVNELCSDPALDLISAVPAVAADFTALSFWQSVFAVPYHGLRPADSVTGNLYAGRRVRLSPLDAGILHEDLALSLRHEGAFRVSTAARVYVTPPRRLGEFLRQRVRCLRADMTEEKRFEKDVAPHRRRHARDVFDFLRAAGPLRLGAFLFARAVASAIARWQGPHSGGGWFPDAGR